MYQYKEKYTIDFTSVENYLDIHFIIKQALDFPDYYGCNWSSLWDCLTDMYGDPIYIEIIGLDIIKNKFDNAVDKLLEILKRFKNYQKIFADEINIEIVTDRGRIAIE